MHVVLLSISKSQLPLSNTPRDLIAMMQSSSLSLSIQISTASVKHTQRPQCHDAVKLSLYIQISTASVKHTKRPQNHDAVQLSLYIQTSTASVKHTQKPQSHHAVLLSISRPQVPMSTTPRDLRVIVQSCSLYQDLNFLCQTDPETSEPTCSPALCILISTSCVKQTQRSQSYGAVLLSVSRPQAPASNRSNILRPYSVVLSSMARHQNTVLALGKETHKESWVHYKMDGCRGLSGNSVQFFIWRPRVGSTVSAQVVKGRSSPHL